MKMICLNGSPLKDGNTATMIRVFSETAAELGADVETIHLNELTYRGCQSCMRCKGETEYCTVEDDLTNVLESVRESDVLVMGSPIYFGEVSSQLKGFIDRTFSFLNPGFTAGNNPSRLAPGKSLVVILPQGAPDASSFNDVYPRYAGFFKYFGYEHRYELRGCGLGDPDDASKHTDLLENVRNVDREIAG